MIWQNLLDYNDDSLDEIEVNGERYLADTDYSPDAVIGQAFGADLDENSYNQILAQTVSDAQQFYGEDFEVFVQEEIAECMSEELKDYAFVAGEVYEEGEDSDVLSKYSTKEMFELHHDNVQRQGLDAESVVYVAHPAHMERVKGIGENVGFEGRPFVRSEVEWPSDDDQPWVRSPLLWGPRELAARSFRKIGGEM